MKRNTVKSILLLLSLMCILGFQGSVVCADIYDAEVQTVQLERIDIQLGTKWPNAEFELKTDNGGCKMSVNQSRVVRLKIDGNRSYILTCEDLSTKAPALTQATATTVSSKDVSESTVVDIPILHLCLFIGGMILSLGGLISMHIGKRRRKDEANDEE